MFALALRLIEHETEQEAFDQLYTRYQGRAQGDAEGPLDVRLGLVCIHSQRINGKLVRCI